jgi:NAD(P)-dependent dehydrogenase (short-subunit alcohol dehydrogenase family)
MSASKSQQVWTAVVTGGASGIGAAVSRKLASRGINVLIADISRGQGEKLAEELKSEHKVDAAFLFVDVSKEADVIKMIETVVQKWGRLDYAANVAGICESSQFEEHSITTDVVDRYGICQSTMRVFCLTQCAARSLSTSAASGFARSWKQSR